MGIKAISDSHTKDIHIQEENRRLKDEKKVNNNKNNKINYNRLNIHVHVLSLWVLHVHACICTLHNNYYTCTVEPLYSGNRLKYPDYRGVLILEYM